MAALPAKLVRYDLDGLDPFQNLAVEELLARTCPADVLRLVFYRNRPAVVIGRSQNPWVEVDLDAVHGQGVAVARRVSGGGTVVHDEGNLNYGFIVPRTLYSPDRFVGIVVEALRALGIAASACARHSVWVQERKVSGTAFLLTGRVALLHGCVLVHSDLQRVRRLLEPLPGERRCRAVASVRSPVTRLCDLAPGLSPATVREAIAAAAGRQLAAGTAPDPVGDRPAPEAVTGLVTRLRSWEWVYGRTPEFEHVLHVAGAPLVLQVKHARIAAMRAAVLSPWVTVLEGVWAGCLYEREAMAAALAAAPGLGSAVRAELEARLRSEIPQVRSRPAG